MNRNLHRRAGMLLAFVTCLSFTQQRLLAEEPAQPKKVPPAKYTVTVFERGLTIQTARLPALNQSLAFSSTSRAVSLGETTSTARSGAHSACFC